MPDTHEPIAYAEQIAFLRDSIQALVKEAVEVFEQDYPQFFVREARQAFLDAPEFARELSDDQLEAIKKAIATDATAATTALVNQLGDLNLWLAGTAAEEPSGKSFEGNETVWAVLASICDKVEATLKRLGFPEPEDGFGVTYTEPKRFVSGHYLPSITEKYWKRVSELKELEEQVEELETERERAELLARWNKF